MLRRLVRDPLLNRCKREKERQTDRQTDRDVDRGTKKESLIGIEGRKRRERERERGRERERDSAFSPCPAMFSKAFSFRVVKSRDYAVKLQLFSFKERMSNCNETLR